MNYKTLISKLLGRTPEELTPAAHETFADLLHQIDKAESVTDFITLELEIEFFSNYYQNILSLKTLNAAVYRLENAFEKRKEKISKRMIA